MHRLLRRSLALLSYVPTEMRRGVVKPLPSSFFYRAFRANWRTANATANTRFLQSMCDGTLSPADFGRFMVLDAYYCFNAHNTFQTLLGKIDHKAQPELYDLIASNVEAYVDYNRTFVEDWHIRNATSVLPTTTMANYVEHERRVAREEEPIYALVAYLPCYYLWPWCVRKMMTSPRYNPGVYEEWFESIYQCECEGFGGAWLLGSFIEKWMIDGKPFDEELAHSIYRRSMEFELAVFGEACSEA